MERKRWYKDKVFYQIWPRSFKDGDGDGMGDLWGVYEKLDYIKSLGCDGIWFSPIYPSPGADCGYDISNYRDIAPEFGGMEAFKKVLEGAHARDMKVVMDLVVNHTSDEHEWFQKSRQRIDPYTDYYIWRPGKPGGKLPNNWDSFFEGKAWTFDEVRGEYYLHLFAVKQPDLNMDNPKVREEVKEILRFWLDMGVDGFREDVITYISKKEGLPDDHLMPTCKGMKVSMSADGRLQVTDALRTVREPVHLSLGTCQQLYLALRIALLVTADNVGRAVPIIADDILVNFDSQRRAGAAKALAQLARHRQVILLTCHEEIVETMRVADPGLTEVVL